MIAIFLNLRASRHAKNRIRLILYVVGQTFECIISDGFLSSFSLISRPIRKLGCTLVLTYVLSEYHANWLKNATIRSWLNRFESVVNFTRDDRHPNNISDTVSLRVPRKNYYSSNQNIWKYSCQKLLKRTREQRKERKREGGKVDVQYTPTLQKVFISVFRILVVLSLLLVWTVFFSVYSFCFHKFFHRVFPCFA